MAVLLFLGLQWFKAAMGLCQAEMRMNTFGKSSNLALAARPNINPLRLHGGIMNRRQISEPEQSSHEQTIRTDEEESTEKDMEATCKSSPRNTGQYLGQCMCSWRTLELRGGSSVDWGGTKYERGTRQVNDNLNGGDSAEVQQEAQEQRFTFVSSVAYFIFRLRIGWRRMLHSLESWAKLVGLGFLGERLAALPEIDFGHCLLCATSRTDLFSSRLLSLSSCCEHKLMPSSLSCGSCSCQHFVEHPRAPLALRSWRLEVITPTLLSPCLPSVSVLLLSSSKQLLCVQSWTQHALQRCPSLRLVRKSERFPSLLSISFCV